MTGGDVVAAAAAAGWGTDVVERSSLLYTTALGTTFAITDTPSLDLQLIHMYGQSSYSNILRAILTKMPAK